MTERKLKWRRRKEERPSEILNAAVEVFAENGFASANLADIAERAGVVKASLYRYFDNKEDLFRAVIQSMLSIRLGVLEECSNGCEGEFRDVIPKLLTQAAIEARDSQLPMLLRIVIAESRTFPDLATIWHDEIHARIMEVLTKLVQIEQAKGRMRAGDAKLYAFAILGPILAANLLHEVLGGKGAPDVHALALLHADMVLNGLATKKREDDAEPWFDAPSRVQGGGQA